MSEHAFYMSRALYLARKGWYTTMPNPRVGCVLVKEQVIVGEGWHVEAGLGHAEVNAIAVAGVKAQGATAYVTLEPCSHTGRTGPCYQALIKAGVSRVVYGMQDPNPKVSGRGLQGLVDAGIEVIGPICEADALALNPGFIARMQTGRAKISAKLAMSVDARTAMASGESQWITGPDARAQVQLLRAQSCAIITGIGSILIDDSALTIRPEQLPLDNAEQICQRQPVRLVLDSGLKMPTQAKILQQAGLTKVFYCQGDVKRIAELEQAGAELIQLPANAAGSIDLNAFGQWLAQQEFNEVLLETGAELAGAFVQAGLVDELKIFMAPKLLGSQARPLLQLPLESMSAAIDLDIDDIRAVGKDWLISAKPIPALDERVR